MIKSYKWLICFAFLLPACYLFKEATPLPEKLLPVTQSWIDEKFQRMSLDQKIGQLILVSAKTLSFSDYDPAYLKIKDYVRRYHIAGLLIENGEAYQLLSSTNRLQSISATPLLIAANFRNGVGGPIEGGTAFISQTGLAATGESDFAYETGKITASEARALGFHLTLSPCAATAGESVSFITYGKDPAEVEKYCVSNIRGLQENGLLACATHFPGIVSGATTSQIGKNLISLKDWQENGLQPFSEAIRAGVAFIMPENGSFPVLDQGFDRPAALSPYLLTEILRNKLKFEGVVISDLLTNDIVKQTFYPGYTAVKALDAGVDLIILEDNIPSVFAALRQAVQDKKISVQRIDTSVKRILYWKSVLGLEEHAISDTDLARTRLQTSASLKTADKIAAKSITLLNNQDLPLAFKKDLRLCSIAYTSASDGSSAQAAFLHELAQVFPFTRSVTFSTDFSQEKMDSLLEDAADSDVIVNLYYCGNARQLSDRQNFLIGQLDSLRKTVVHIFFGPPQLGRNFSHLKNLLLIYAAFPNCQRVVADVLTGRLPVAGRLPVNIAGLAAKGRGDMLSQQTMVLEPVNNLTAFANPLYLDSLKNFLQISISDSAFPGCAITVGYRNHLLLNEAFGRFTYDPQSIQDQPNSIFDLASVTKVVATTTIAMILYDQGRLNLDWPVQEVVPEFKGKGKDQVTVRHLLTHTSGLPGWVKFYETMQGKERIVQEICHTDLIYQPGTQTVYSDLGMILMQKILETIAQKPLNLLFEEYVASPLGMNRTFYNPEPKYFNEIVPTEMSEFHHKLVRGFVHDENTFAMGGVSGHAGLFSTAEDLAHFCQMYLNGGIYKFKRILQPETIKLFTARQNLVEGSSRAIGWDTRSEEHSMAGKYMSMQAFGHSGFTGTTVWLDPVNDVFVVLLTNRVYPTRENQKIRRVRPQVHDYVMQAILGKASENK